MDPTREDIRMVRFKGTGHDDSPFLSAFSPPEVEIVEPTGDLRQSKATSPEIGGNAQQIREGNLLGTKQYEQPRALSPFPLENTSKLDHLLSVRRNIVESLHLLSNERQSLFQNQKNCYQEARNFLQDQNRLRKRNERLNQMDKNDRNYRRYHTINDIPRLRQYYDTAKPSTTAFQEVTSMRKGNFSPTSYTATGDRWSYQPATQHNHEDLTLPTAKNHELSSNYRMTTQKRHQYNLTENQENTGMLDPFKRDQFLDRSWPRRYARDVPKADEDLIHYLDMVEKSDSLSPGNISPQRQYFTEIIPHHNYYGHQFQRPVEMALERSQINNHLDRDTKLSYEHFTRNPKPNLEASVKRTPSFNQEVRQLKLQLSKPKRAESKESCDDKTSSLVSSDADSDFLFCPCSSSMVSSPRLPDLTPSLQYVSRLSSSNDTKSALRDGRDNGFDASLDDITKQFYFDDDALSDDVFVDDYQGEEKRENLEEGWYRNLDDFLSQSDGERCESSGYVNIAEINSKYYKNGDLKAKAPFDSHENQQQPVEKHVVLNPKSQEDDPWRNFKSVDQVCYDYEDVDNSTECEDLCSEMSNFNLNLANAFDSLRRNSTQSKSRKLWKERRSRIKKSPAKLFRQLTPRFEENEGEKSEINMKEPNVSPRIFTFDDVESPSTSNNDSPSVKRPLKGILKNKVDSPVSIKKESVTSQDAIVEYDFCDIQEVDSLSPDDTRRDSKDLEHVENQSNILIDMEYNKMNDSLSLSGTGNHRSKYVSVGVQVNLIGGILGAQGVLCFSCANTIKCEDHMNYSTGSPYLTSRNNENKDETPEKTNIEDSFDESILNLDHSEGQLETHSKQRVDRLAPPMFNLQTEEEGEIQLTDEKPQCQISDQSKTPESQPVEESASYLVEVDEVKKRTSEGTSENVNTSRDGQGKYPSSEVLLSKDDHEFHYLLSPTETGTTETIAVRKNSLEVYKWTRSWQRRVKNQNKKTANKIDKSGEKSFDEQLNSGTGKGGYSIHKNEETDEHENANKN